MAPVLTLHEGGASKTYKARPSELRRTVEVEAVREIVHAIDEQSARLPVSPVRKALTEWSQQLTEWCDKDEDAR